MDANNFKRTKIIATIGPASDSPDRIEALLKAGVNGVRLNLSHNTHQFHVSVIKHTRAASKKLDRAVALIADLQGPRIRLGSLPNAGFEVKTGDKFSLKFGIDRADGNVLPIQHNIAAEVSKNQPLFLRDGQIKTTIVSVKKDTVIVRALNSGKLGSNHGINLPETEFKSGILTPKDHRDIDFVLKNDVDYIALSFVQSPQDVIGLRQIIQKAKSDTKIIAKIETRVATTHLDEIIKQADVVMVARGDLAIETLPEEVPVLQHKIITHCRLAKTPVIIATQMLESMMNSLQPSRAEVNDIASAVTSGADAVMLSGETAIGKFPIQTVVQMKKVILATESFIRDENKTFTPPSMERKDLGISLAAVTLAAQLEAKVILAETLTGNTARSIASLRPYQAIMMASPSAKVCNQLAIVWGSKPFLVKKGTQAAKYVLKILKKRGSLKAGDVIVTAFGKNRNVSGGTDTVRLVQVP